MNKHRIIVKPLWKLILPLLFLSLLSVSCGSSSGGTGGTGMTPGFSKGIVTGFGSVIVNGVKFNTDNASFTIDDNPGTQNDLALGMVVAVRGTVNDDGTTGEATHVEFEEEIEGPIDAIDLVNNKLVVLGRTVIIDDTTKMEDAASTPLTLADLNNNDMLEVSGLVFADDRIQATYIKRKTGTFSVGVSELELKGIVKGLDVTARTFSIAGQLVNYSTANFDGMTSSDLQAGSFIEVKGTRDALGTLNAVSIQKEDGGLEANEDEHVELEGLVTDFSSSSVFSVNGQAVTSTSSTVFENGAPDDITAGVRLEVEGTISGGVLVATKVKFHGNRIKIEANVESTDPSANTVTLLGKAVHINGSTEMDDKSSANKSPFLFSDIKAGERLEIRAYLSGGIITATRVNREDAKSKVLLQAPVDAINDPDLTLLGIRVKTSGALLFKDLSENVISIGTFFSQVKSGDLIKTTGVFSSGDILAEEVEFEG